MTSRPVPPFAEPLASCVHSAVHLETWDVYAIADEDAGFLAWRRGEDPHGVPGDVWWSSFHDAIAQAVGRGVVVRRARVVSEPHSEYIRHATSRNLRRLARRSSSEACVRVPGALVGRIRRLLHGVWPDGRTDAADMPASRSDVP
ncbi:DUF6879 family protein [Streptomyces sp. WMMC1477]|uniref:DUF6879 family protein n=1 Tax=Streptomyces sp. WMMC1477 TaxID=3015155 RepID=UPI002FC2ACCD